MAPLLTDYDLPDAHLFSGGVQGILAWQPSETVIVLGQSNTVATSLHAVTVDADGIRVTKRPSGGEAVILTPATVAYTVARRFPAMIPFSEFFRMVNSVVIGGLASMGVERLGTRGISDITIDNRKIVGSSMRKLNEMLIYHAVMNLAEDPAIFGRYLLHPRREPDYRAGRSHTEFVTSLAAEGYSFTPDTVISMLNSVLPQLITGEHHSG